MALISNRVKSDTTGECAAGYAVRRGLRGTDYAHLGVFTGFLACNGLRTWGCEWVLLGVFWVGTPPALGTRAMASDSQIARCNELAACAAQLADGWEDFDDAAGNVFCTLQEEGIAVTGVWDNVAYFFEIEFGPQP